jgi:hypothetical protein
MLLGNTKEGFSTIKFEKIEFIRDNKGAGILLPKLHFILNEAD